MTRLNKEICIETNKFRNLNWNNMLTTMEKASLPLWNIPILKDNSQESFTQQEKQTRECF